MINWFKSLFRKKTCCVVSIPLSQGIGAVKEIKITTLGAGGGGWSGEVVISHDKLD